MVNLPQIPRRLVLVQAPESSVTAADVAAPYRQMGDALNKMGETTEAIATQFAEEAGQKAVRKDDQGNIVVDRVPILGPAGVAYARAAQFTALARLQPQIETEATKMRLKYPNDPEGFKTAWQGYTEQIEANSGAVSPALAGAARKIAESEGGQQYRSSLVEADRTNAANMLKVTQARLAEINDRTASLARQGGTDTPEYAAALFDRAQLLHNLTTDPRLKYPQELAQHEAAESRDADTVQAVIGQAQRLYGSKKNAVEAQRFLQDAFWGKGSENLQLSARKRDAGVSEGLKALERTQVEDKLGVQLHAQVVTKYLDDLEKNPSSFNDVAHNALVAKSIDLGDLHTRMALDAARIVNPMNKALLTLPPDQRNAALAEMGKGLVPKISQGYAARTFQIESGGNPAAVTGSNRGLGQFGPAEERQFGITDANRRDPAAQTRALALEAAENRPKLAAVLGRQPTDAELYIAHQQGVAGGPALLAQPDKPAWEVIRPFYPDAYARAHGFPNGDAMAKVAISGNIPKSSPLRNVAVESIKAGEFTSTWTAFYEKGGGALPARPTLTGELQPGAVIAANPNPYVAKLFQSTVEELRQQQGKVAEKLGGQIIAMAGAGDAVPAATLQTFAAAAEASGKSEDLTPKVQTALAAYDASHAAVAGGVASADALQAQISAAKASGVDPVTYDVLTATAKSAAASTARLRTDTLDEAGRLGIIQPINPIDPANPQNAAIELAQREQKMQAVRLHPAGQGLGPSSLIGENEGAALKTALTQGDPAKAGQLLDALATLPEADYKATLGSKPIAEALGGMVRSRDPARMTAGFGALDRFWRIDPAKAEAAFGSDTMTHLAAWEGLRLSFTPAEIAERMNRADDPGIMAARGKLKTEAEAEMAKWAPGDVAYQLGSGNVWGIPFTGRLTGRTPAVPADPIASGELLADYRGIYVALRQYGVDADNAQSLAAQRLRSTWGASETAGGQLMKTPPESYYTKINDSHAWMREDLQALVTSIKGPAVTIAAPNTFDPGVPVPNWTIKGLVADPQTQAEIRAGKPPSYLVAIDTGSGMTEFLSDPAGGNRRVAWDPAEHVAAEKADFENRRARVRFMRDTRGVPGSVGGF